MGATYRVIRAWAGLLVATWYRTQVVGAQVPKTAPVVMVVNHTNGLCDGHFQLAVTERPVHVLAKYKLFEIPVLGWVVRNVGAIPVYRKKDGVDTSRNTDSFRAIHEALAKGDVIAVFPEGESRATPFLRELKTGAARMALGAEEGLEWRAGVQIVPVGITYEDTERFRSRAEAWVGEPLVVHDCYAAWHHSPILAGRALTERISKAMRALTLEVPPGEDQGAAARAFACAGERLMPPDDRPLAARRQAVWDGLERHRELDPEGHPRRVAAVHALDRNLAAYGLTAREVLDAAPRSAPSLVLEIGLRALLGVPALALVALVWGPPVSLARLIARRGASTSDKFVTVTLLVTFAAVLFWWPLLVVLGSSRFPELGLIWSVAGVALGGALLPRSFDNLRELRRTFGRLRLASDPEARQRLEGSLRTLAASLAARPETGAIER